MCIVCSVSDILHVKNSIPYTLSVDGTRIVILRSTPRSRVLKKGILDFFYLRKNVFLIIFLIRRNLGVPILLNHYNEHATNKTILCFVRIANTGEVHARKKNKENIRWAMMSIIFWFTSKTLCPSSCVYTSRTRIRKRIQTTSNNNPFASVDFT